MFTYIRRCLTSPNPARALWAMALALATLSALPVAMASTLLAPAAAALLFTGDPGLASDLAPTTDDLPGGIWIPILVGLILGTLLWSRLYAVAVWASDDANDGGLRASFRATRGAWRKVCTLYLHYGLVMGVLVAFAFAPGLSGDGRTAPTAGVVVVGLGVRTAIRILLTLGIRAVVLEDLRRRAAWRKAWVLLRERRRETSAVWVTLVALGMTVWVGGRLLSPVLQDTALDYPSSSAYALAREAGQLLVAIPLEAFLMVVAFAGWTAVYLGKEEAEPVRRAPPRPGRPRQTDPWVVRGLAALLVLAVAGNGIPSAIDAAWARNRDGRLARIAGSEVAPEEVLAAPEESPPGAPEAPTAYRVDARLDDDRLIWTTRLSYVNHTGETLEDVGLHLYPAAYTRKLEDIPLADTLLQGDLTGTFRARAEPGTFKVRSVEVAGHPVRWSRDDTALTVPLIRPLEPARTTVIVIRLEARLPQWPERFGVWDERILLGNWIPTVAVREQGAWRLDGFSGVGDPFFSEVADYRVSLELDEALGAVGTGHLIGIAAGSSRDRRVWSFRARASRDAAFAVSASFRGLEQRAGGVLVRSWYRADERERGASNLEAAVDAIRSFRLLYGGLPHDEVDMVETGGFLGGMEYPGVIFTSNGSGALEGVPLLGDLLRHAGFDAAQERYVIGHELAHQWWYAAVGNDQIEEPWLDEAFAETSTRLWLRRADGDDRIFKMVNGASEVPARAGVISAGVDDFGSNSAYTEAVYLAGANVLLALRERLGTATWTRIMRSWYRRQMFGIGTVEEFIDTVEDVAGPGAARRLRSYL